MPKEKMSLEKMKTVLSEVLSREEMKQVLAGSAPPDYGDCGICYPGNGFGEWCVRPGPYYTGPCTCHSNPSRPC